MEETQTKVEVPKVYYYYPAHNAKFVRRVLAGVVSDGILYVAQAALFPGFKPKLVPIKFRNGDTVFVVDPGMPADVYNKKEGRRIATERCTGIKTVGENRYPVGRSTIYTTRLPEGDVNPGKFFVEIVELYLQRKGFPAKASKPKKDAPEPNQPGE